MKRTHILTATGIAFGLAAGYLYWFHYGCTNGCTITSKPLNSSLYGAAVGGLLFNMIAGLFTTKQKSKSDDQTN